SVERGIHRVQAPRERWGPQGHGNIRFEAQPGKLPQGFQPQRCQRANVWLEDVHQVTLFRARDLELSPGAEYGHLDHDPGIRAQSLQITDAGILVLGLEVLERAHQRLEYPAHPVDIPDNAGGDEARADM